MDCSRVEYTMEITNTIDFANYAITYDLPNGTSLIGNDLDYISEENECIVEFEFDEATI